MGVQWRRIDSTAGRTSYANECTEGVNHDQKLHAHANRSSLTKRWCAHQPIYSHWKHLLYSGTIEMKSCGNTTYASIVAYDAVQTAFLYVMVLKRCCL